MIAPLLLAATLAFPADYIDHFADPNDIGTLKVPRKGVTHVLVIPVAIDDLPFDQGSLAGFEDEVRTFYAPDASGWAFTPYYKTLSLGRFEPQVTVAPTVHFPTCPQLGDFADCQIPRGGGAGEGDFTAASTLIKPALEFLDDIIRCATAGPNAEVTCTSGGGVDLHDFDTSGKDGAPDGVTDGVIIISNAGFPGIALPVRDIATNQLLSFFGPFPSFQYGDMTVGQVAIEGSEHLPQHATFVSVHEFGHLLGWCDLYNEDQTSTDMPYTLMGGWFYADPGSLVDGYSRIAAGFGHVIQVAKSGTFDLGPSDETGTVLKVGTGDEFFTVELRRKTDATDGDLSVDAGVVVERVRLQKRPSATHGNYLGTLSHCVNCDVFDTFLAVEQPSGTFDLEGGRPRNDERDLFQAGDSIAPSDDTEPRSLTHEVFSSNRYDGSRTGITITVVEADAEHATVDVTLEDEVSDPCAEIAPYCGDDLACTNTDGFAECGRVSRPAPTVPPAPTPEGCPGCSGGAARGGDVAVAGALAALFVSLRRGRRRR